ncbi:tetratricopeptide repeat protein [Ovoidimarina sediminis]|uniref:tetratricopeptide repeat protein n=1 Tax=Ovoidimarina sediminis TaxID=3079856 RepID=UPI0029134977|nr:tetratricopeptide repeat protein [Rhodophyticola sp. MJ-SS7]MDU8942576.1 tetratricopeptide repeat protein [Rhodophyticola sp. MJ-SS7]
MSLKSLRLATAGWILIAGLTLAACDTAEERAEEHYENALELVAAGDVARAAIEFRNVFSLNGQHRDARMAYARMQETEGDFREAYRHYNLVAEQYPNDPEARLALAQLAIRFGDWDEVRRHGERLAEVSPDNESTGAIFALLEYQDAVEAEDETARRSAVARIIEIKDDLPDGSIASHVAIDSLLRDGDMRGALEQVDAILEREPLNERFHQLRLQLLGQLRDLDETQIQLETMVQRFPESERYKQALIQWYVSNRNLPAAEAFIRDQIAASEGETQTSFRALLLRFKRETEGVEPALEEVDRMLASGAPAELFGSIRAGLIYDLGNRDEAIAEMEAIIGEAEDTDEIRNIKVSLAKMQMGVGNEVAARQKIEEVLEADPGNVPANKMRASWLIEDDMGDDAILALRTALDQAPDDAEIMSLMAQAHLRNGSRGLAGEMMALAVEASGSGAKESLTYARFLIADDEYNTAERILIDSLRRDPSNTEILNLLGRIYLELEDWARAEQVEGTLRRFDSTQSVKDADALQVARLQRQGRRDEAIAFLEELARSDGSIGGPDVALVRQRLEEGQVAAALNYVDERLESAPDDPLLRTLRAAVLQSDEQWEAAEETYREVLAENPEIEGVWRSLYSMKLRQGEPDAARAVLQEGLAAMPNAANLLWAYAGQLERDGDIDGAITIYERLYERLPNAPVIANNLASLIATYREDEESLDRAYTIARRLRGTDIAAFQDTYGWIAHRRGDFEEAIDHLEPAARGLPGDPIVQYHLAAAYAASERYDEAIAQFRKALDIAGPADTRPQFERAREEIERLEALRQQ